MTKTGQKVSINIERFSHIGAIYIYLIIIFFIFIVIFTTPVDKNTFNEC